MDLQTIADQVGPHLHRAVREAFETVNRRLIQHNDFTAALPDRVISATVTELAKVLLLQVEGISRAAGPRDEFLLDLGGERHRFRINRSRVRGAVPLAAVTADDLSSPTGNGVSAHSTHSLFHILWFAEGGAFGGVWVVKAAVPLEAQAGTQFATYQTVDGRWWSEAVEVPQSQQVDIQGIEVQPVERTVDLGLSASSTSGSAAAGQAG